MHSPAANDELRGFHQFLGEKLKNGGAHLSPEEALDEWRERRPDLRRRVKAKTKNRKGPASNGGARQRDEPPGKHREPGEFPDDTEAILEAIHDMENGDTGRDFDEFMAEIRASYGLPKQ